MAFFDLGVKKRSTLKMPGFHLRKMEQEIDRFKSNADSCGMVIAIFYSAIPALTWGHWLTVAKSMRLWIKLAEITLFHRVAGPQIWMETSQTSGKSLKYNQCPLLLQKNPLEAVLAYEWDASVMASFWGFLGTA